MKRSVPSTRPLLKRSSAEIRVDHNPFLKRALHPGAGAPAKGSIEPLESENFVWQTRAAPPTDYENALADALERVFGEGAETPAEVVKGLNALGFRRPDGGAWDEPGFEAEMRRQAQP